MLETCLLSDWIRTAKKGAWPLCKKVPCIEVRHAATFLTKKAAHFFTSSRPKGGFSARVSEAWSLGSAEHVQVPKIPKSSDLSNLAGEQWISRIAPIAWESLPMKLRSVETRTPGSSAYQLRPCCCTAMHASNNSCTTACSFQHFREHPGKEAAQSQQKATSSGIAPGKGWSPAMPLRHATATGPYPLLSAPWSRWTGRAKAQEFFHAERHVWNQLMGGNNWSQNPQSITCLGSSIRLFQAAYPPTLQKQPEQIICFWPKLIVINMV